MPGGTCTLIGDYVVQASDVTAGQIDNLGTADSDQTDPVTDPETVPVPNPELSIDKPAPTNADEDGSGDVSVGDTLSLHDHGDEHGHGQPNQRGGPPMPLLSNLSGTTPCALVMPGGTCTLIGDYVVQASDGTAGQIDNLGTADSDQTDPVTDPETVPGTESRAFDRQTGTDQCR